MENINQTSSLKLGVLGMSEGNGHPYSWSAIFNGYDPTIMKDCPFSGIPDYLSKQKFPEDTILNANVTHIWTQDVALSNHISKASLIPFVVERYEDMIGHVDGVLLARDDAENHFTMAKPFLEAGLPVFIDKPLAYTIREAKEILALQKFENQIFSCSGLAYAAELKLTEKDKEKLGAIKLIDAIVPKQWNKYAIHIIEPVLNLVGKDDEILSVANSGGSEINIVTVKWRSGLHTVFYVIGDNKCPFAIIRLFGSNGFKELKFQDTFNAFKNSLLAFVDVVLDKNKQPNNPKRLLEIIRIIGEGAIVG